MNNKKTILVVDDSSVIRNMATRALEQHYHVITAIDGIEGLRLWRANKDKLSLIITDVNMPELDGMEMVRKLRTLDTRTPVLFLTTESSTDRKMEGKAAGAQGWIVKQFAPEKLRETIAKVV